MPMTGFPVAARSPDPAEVDRVIDLIAVEQARPERNVPTLATERTALVDELEEGEPPWRDTLRVTLCEVADSGPGVICGAIVVDWNVGARRAWVHGPWVGVGDGRWLDHGVSLVESTLEQLPSEIEVAVLTADVRNRSIARLAEILGWPTGEVNHALAANVGQIASPDRGDAEAIRDISGPDVDAFGALHDAEFPKTYFSAAQLVDRVGTGEQEVLVACDRAGQMCGYAAGRVQPDGDAYIDFLAVMPDARRTGTGRSLVVALARRLLPSSTTKRICLTVRDSNRSARSLYESLGFEIDVSIATYESPSPPGGERPAPGEPTTAHDTR